MGIEKHIKDLLYGYDCVIVPEFGGFIANYESAKVDLKTHQFTPPSRRISFNSNLKRNDGLLADKIAEKKGVSYESAKKAIDTFVSLTYKDLNGGKRITFAEIGTFHYDKEGNIQFNPDTSINYLAETFGFTSFNSPVIVRDTIERKIEKKIISAKPKLSKDADKKGKTHDPAIKITKYWPAAAVFLLGFLIWGSFQTSFVKDVSLNYSDINPFKESVSPNYHPRDKETAIVSSIYSEGKDKIETWLENVPKEPSAMPIMPKVAKRFHVIGGCFEVKTNAKNLMSRLKRKGFNPQMVGKNNRGLHRVAYGSYETRKEAKKALRSIKKNHMKSAWLFIK